jgi:hypothetical protein
VLSAAVGAALTGLVLGRTGALLTDRLPSVANGLLVAAAIGGVGYGIAELLAFGWPVPTRRWQVPRHWAKYGLPAFASAFGFLLGPGFFTIVSFSGYYLLLAWCFLAATPWLRAAVLLATAGALLGVALDRLSAL